jgi:uncharacterized protein (TIGR01777 family)
MVYYFEKRNILIAGATGLIGTALIKLYKEEGHTIRVLSTNKKFVEENEHAFYWNVEEGYVDEKAFKDIEILVNLAGANIAGGLWTKKRKALIYNSRILGTRLLYQYLEKLDKKILVYIGASAVGFYGPNNSFVPKVETDQRGEGFLADVCYDWEAEHWKFESRTETLVIPRLSNVLAHEGGFLMPYRKLSKFGLRILFGNSNELVSWIHIEDVVRFMSYVLYVDIRGPVNLAVGDANMWLFQHYLYDRFGDQIARLRIPNFIIKKVFGQMSTLMLDGNYASGRKMDYEGFMIKYLDIDTAIDEIVYNS